MILTLLGTLVLICAISVIYRAGVLYDYLGKVTAVLRDDAEAVREAMEEDDEH
jgi:hypothetical protein